MQRSNSTANAGSQLAPCYSAFLPNPCSQTPAELGPMQGRVSGQQGRQQDQEAGQQQQELGLSLIPADGQKRRKGFRMGLLKMWTSQTF